MKSLEIARPEQQMALQLLQTTSKIATAEQLAAVRLNPNIPRFYMLKKADRINWLKDQIFVLNYMRHVKEVNELDILIDATATDYAITEEQPGLATLTQVEMQDAFRMGINGSFGEFYGITPATLVGFLNSYWKIEKRQKSTTIIYQKKKAEEEEKQRRFDKAMYEAKSKGFEIPFWPSKRGKKKVTESESDEHRKLIEKQRNEILKNSK